MQETFIDLDELILRCRDKTSKKFIQEAVSCYRAGAYRSCKDIEKPDPKIIEVFDVSIDQYLKNISIYDLLDKSPPERFHRLWDQLLHESNNEIIKPILKSGIPLIIQRFEKSSSFDSAEYNARLVSKIAEYLDPVQWKIVFDAFCKNDQIYKRGLCHFVLKDLFKECFKINNNIVPDYWLDFRDQLDKSNRSSLLKRTIDSYEETFKISEDYKKSQ